MKKVVPILSLLCLTFLSEMAFCQTCEEFEANLRYEAILPRCNKADGEIIINNALGGIPPYLYQLDTTRTSIGAFFDLDTGIYSIQVTDARGCKDTVDIALEYEAAEDIIKPYNAFTPNGDGLNDTWVIPGITRFQNAEVVVFNRWGQQVYVNSFYDNLDGWDGASDGSKLAPATYFYVITVVNDCRESSIAGSVAIMK